MNPTGIVFAADIPKKAHLLKTIEEVSPHVEAIKIGNVVLWEHGLPIIETVKQHTEKPVIVDLKFMDIPHMAKLAANRILSYGGDGIMVSGPVGGEAVSACKSILSDKMVFVFTQFTHMSGLITDDMADEYVDLALSLKCTGVQVPGTIPGRVKEIRNRVGDQLVIISCGVGAQGPKIGSAVADGANYEIVGRWIYEPSAPFGKPAEAAEHARTCIVESASQR